MTTNPYALAEQAAEKLVAATGARPFDVGIVLGSGWQQAAETLAPIQHALPTASLPGFIPPSVAGHGGQIMAIDFAGLRVALLSGRIHLYEGHEVASVVHPVRTLVAAGAKTVIVTNACGGINPAYGPGTTMLIKDHINLTATSPLEGPSPPEGYGSRFCDLSDLYSKGLRQRIQEVRPDLVEGVYVGFRGPHYESPAEIRMAKTIGGDLVGMSTVLEAIAAKHMGASVLGLSLITNLAAGVSPTPLNHLEVLEAGQKAAAGLADLFRDILKCLN
jgi:purine-nucleoside phosphorylase